MLFAMNFMIVPGMLVCSSFQISLYMFIGSKVLPISSAKVIDRAGRAIWLNPFAAVYLMCIVPSLYSIVVVSAVLRGCVCCYVRKKALFKCLSNY